MKFHLYLIIISVFLLAACAPEHQSMDEMMANMPCHQMPDGSWMGDCDTQQNEVKDVFADDLAKLEAPTAKSTTVVDLADGETYTMTAEIVKKTIDGKEVIMYGYNGMIPGPTLRADQGSTVFIDFTNNIDMDTTVHWHGLRHDLMNDGVPMVSQPPVKPGESFRYELYFPDDGVYWYHPHIREDVQQDRGLAGNILVVPANDTAHVDQEEVLILDDILMDANGVVSFGDKHANFALMGRFGNVMLVNGEEDYTLDVQANKVVRLYLTNVANVRPFNLSIPGAQIKLVGGDLGFYEREEFVDSIIITPAERYIVDIFFEEEGDYPLMHINPHEEYSLGLIQVQPNQQGVSSEEYFSTLKDRELEINDIAQFADHFDKDPDYTIDLTVSMGRMGEMPCHAMAGMIMGDCTPEEREQLQEEMGIEHAGDIEWEDEMNMGASASMVKWALADAKSKRENMDLNMTAKVGDVVKMRFFNDPESMHPMQHPIHLHGQRFVVTHIDGEPVANKVWKDTVLVPIGATVDILIDVTNPGTWMMHCHIAEHLEAGMMANFVVEDA